MQKRRFNKQSIEKFCDELKTTSWQSIKVENCPNLAFKSFFEKINSAVDFHFPLTKIKLTSKKLRQAPWMTRGMLISHKTKEKLEHFLSLSMYLREPLVFVGIRDRERHFSWEVTIDIYK